jgi:phosphatidylinositol-3-phosphatase
VRATRPAVLLAAALAVGACGAGAAPEQRASRAIKPCGRAGSPPVRYDHVVWIVMENKSYSDVMSSAKASFTRSLAAACGVATRFHAETHPSLPNYLAMTSGSTHGVRDNAAPSAHRIGGPSIFSQLGSRWRALQESMPQACRRTNFGLYAVKHNPGAYYTNLAATCPKQDLSLSGRPDLSARFAFITPNLCHDTHDCGIGAGDRYLAGLIRAIVGSAEYRSGGTAVFITWDEDDGRASNRIPTIVISPHTQPGTRSATRFNHYSLLRTTEDLLRLKRIGAAAHANSMRTAFRL